MSYTSKSNLDKPIHQREREMLQAGFSYAEVAQSLGSRHKSISERNRLVYKINLRDAFTRRINRDGIPCRLNVSDAFGHWFTGFFDGEGCLTVFSRARRDRYFERRVGIQIILRDDDADVIARIKDNLGVGLISRGNYTGRNPTICYRCEPIKDLAEVIVPLLDKYPLYTKKAREYVIWRQLVIFQYTVTLGGYSQRASGTVEDNTFFDACRQKIVDIRTYTSSH